MKPVKYLILGSKSSIVVWYIEHVKFYYPEVTDWVIKWGFTVEGDIYLNTNGDSTHRLSDIAHFNTPEDALEFFKNNYVNYNKFYGD